MDNLQDQVLRFIDRHKLGSSSPQRETPEEREKRLTDELTQKVSLSQIPERFRGASLADFADGDALFERLGHGAYVYGEPRRGKTHLVSALCIARLNECPNLHVAWFNVATVLYAMRDSFKTQNGRTLSAVHNIFKDSSLVVLDDIGIENPTDWVVETLNVLVNTAYDSKTELLVTSNLTPRELSDRLGSRIAGRIVEVCPVYMLAGENRSVAKAKEMIDRA